MSNSDDTTEHSSEPTPSSPLKAAKQMHGKWFKTMMGTYMVLFLFCVVVLMYDHFKYGAKIPPNSSRKFFRAVEAILLALVFIFVIHMITIIYTIYKTDKEFGVAGVWYTVLFLLLTVSSIYWAYYHFAMGPAYNKKTTHTKKEQNERKIYTVAKWTSIISMFLLMVSLCMGAGGFLESYFCFRMIGEIMAAFT
jgi:archaellum biogenesis protein FlaJ (TadC family)